MAIKKIQKMFYYSSEYVKKFIESRLDDLSIKTKHSTSYLIETILLDGLLPKNEEARAIIQNNLYPDSAQGGVKKTLDSMFSINAAGAGWKSKHDNLKPLVEYCIYYCSTTPTYNQNDGYLQYFLGQLRSIVDRIENCTNSCIEIIDRKMYASQLELAKVLLKTAEEQPEDIIPRNHFQLVYDCWDMLDDWSITYRYLSCLVAICDFQENSNARNKLYDIISEISEEW